MKMKKITVLMTITILCLFFSNTQLDASESGHTNNLKTLNKNNEVQSSRTVSESSVLGTGFKLGVFDMQRIIKESKTIQGYREQLLKDVDKKRKPLQDRDNLIRTLDEKLKKDGKIMSPSDKKVFEEKLANGIKDARRMREDLNAETVRMERGVMQKTFMEIDAIVKKIAEKENYTVIFEKTAGGIVHFKDTIDITGKVIEQLK